MRPALSSSRNSELRSAPVSRSEIPEPHRTGLGRPGSAQERGPARPCSVVMTSRSSTGPVPIGVEHVAIKTARLTIGRSCGISAAALAPPLLDALLYTTRDVVARPRAEKDNTSWEVRVSKSSALENHRVRPRTEL